MEICLIEKEVEIVRVNVPKAVIEERDRLVGRGVCLGCGATVPKRLRRGQCDSCYQRTIGKLKKRKVKQSELIRLGLWLPAKKGGRKATNSYTRKLNELCGD